jgi:zinc transporter ZupT
MTSTQISPSQKTSDNQAPAAGGALIQPSAKTGVLSSCSAPVVEQISPSQLQADNHLNFAGGALIQPSATELLMPKVRMPVVEQISPSHIKNENHERSAGGLNLDQTTTMTGSITKFQMSLSDPTHSPHNSATLNKCASQQQAAYAFSHLMKQTKTV